MPEKTSVLLVDDHSLVRRGFRRMPLDYRYTEEDGADLEEGAFRRWRDLGRRRAFSARSSQVLATEATEEHS